MSDMCRMHNGIVKRTKKFKKYNYSHNTLVKVNLYNIKTRITNKVMNV